MTTGMRASWLWEQEARELHVQHQSAATVPPLDDLGWPYPCEALARATLTDHYAGSSHRERQATVGGRATLVRGRSPTVPDTCHIETGVAQTGSHSRALRIFVDLGISRL